MTSYEPGTVVDRRYRLLRKIGAGAHGVVWHARDLETRDEVALKFLKPGLGFDADFNRRLEREARAMALLRGTCAVYVHGLRLAPDATAYLVMEMLHGQDLEAFLTDAERAGGRIKAPRLLQLLRPVADTLERAHDMNIVHRDLKPGNLMVLREGGVRLLDFGLVKLLDEASLTGEGMVAGSPSYIAPEAWRGDPRVLDHRIDVYSLGVIVFRALAGRTPGEARSIVQALAWATQGQRPSLRALRPKLPEAIDPWVQRALAVDPDARFQSIHDLWTSLERILAPEETGPY